MYDKIQEKWTICDMKIEDLMEICPWNQLFITFIMEIIQSTMCKVLDRPFCRTEIYLGRPCSWCSPTPMSGSPHFLVRRVHATLKDAMTVCRSVCPYIGYINYFAVLRLADSYYYPCPTACNLFRLVYGFVRFAYKKKRIFSSLIFLFGFDWFRLVSFGFFWFRLVYQRTALLSFILHVD